MNNRIDFNARIFAGLRVLAILMAIVLPATATSAAERPNVVVLYVDDLGYKDIGCYGGPVKTPALDSLAAGGVRFTDFYSGAAVCSPSRATLLTGRHHFRAGIYNVLVFGDEPMYLLEREVTLAEVLKQNGYSTAHFGKWHVGSSKAPQIRLSPEDHGFDYWFGMHSGASPNHKNPVNFLRNGQQVGKIEGYSCQIVVDEAISWLDEKRDPEAPFFLNLWFHEPHDIVAAPDDIVSQYGDLNDKAAVYSGTIDNTDRAIARLLDKLEKVDLPENTLIVYASDNGSYRSDRVGNLRGKKGSNYEGGIRVPGIFSWPGHITGGRVEGEPAGVVDLLPTVCGLVSIDKPEGVHLDGSDISPLLLGQDDAFTRQQALYWHSGHMMALRRGKYSMVAFSDFQFPRDTEAIAAVVKQIKGVLGVADSATINLYDHFKNKDADRLRMQFLRLSGFQTSWVPVLKSGGYRGFELYDLSTDPGQQNNLAAQLPDVAARLKKEMLDITASVMAEAPDWQPR